MKIRNLLAKFSLVCGFCLLLTSLFGCSTLTEVGKNILGVSTRALEEGRKDAIKQTFAYNLSACYDKLKKALVLRGCYIYALDPGKMIAIYVSETDTTPVGIFFKKVDDNNTRVEVSSPSPWAKEFIARRAASILQGTKDPDAEKEKEMEIQTTQIKENKPLESTMSAHEREGHSE